MNDYEKSKMAAKTEFLKTGAPRVLLALNAAMAIAYFLVLTLLFPIGNKVLFGLLITGEVFHIWQVLSFLYTVWETEHTFVRDESFAPPVDVFITVAGEPVELVEKTVAAARAMDYPNFEIHILNDGFVAGKDNWRDIETLAATYGVHCITRTVPGGAKAGNINNALRLTNNPLVAIFDADHVPHPSFLQKTAAYFVDRSVGFVQTPQFYKNYNENYLTKSSWEQQELFFGPICKGKNRLNAATMCGTNMLISRAALLEVGGMCAESIAEDFVTGLLMHAQGYASVYHPEVLAEGLATEDLLTYSKQQFRWARGALDVIFRYNPLFMRGLSLPQKIQYLSSASFYLSGVFVVIDAMLPIIYLYTGMVPVQIDGMLLAAVFLPYLFFTLYVIQRTSNFTFTFPSLGFSMGSFNIQLKALWKAVTFQKSGFSITEKSKATGNFLPLVKWHIAYIVVALIGVPFALVREGYSASLINNGAWVLLTSIIFVPFIRAAMPDNTEHPQPEIKARTVKTQIYGTIRG
ncbi:MAG TPA: glycosyltransferase [Candidatus Paceibacterota bacterium]|nr:glycosyltransferase [Candidatus Paceibacterota bacterium]